MTLRHNSRPRLQEGLELIYEDRDVVVVDKPAGLLTVGTETEKRRTAYSALFDYLKHQRPPQRIFIVHRLDREASGLLVFAKSETAKRDLQAQFEDHSAGRTYVAVTDGRMNFETRTIRSYLAENAIHRCYSTPDPAKGKMAVTHVSVLRRSPNRTAVEVRLETGRKHQIRVHLAELGFPILGDPVYGNKRSPLRRLALHGMKLTFKHPFTHKVMEFASPPPASFSGLV